MHDDGLAVVGDHVQLGGPGRGIVDHQQVSGVQVVGECGEPGVGQSGRGRDQQPNLIAGQAAVLGWCRGRRVVGGAEDRGRPRSQQRHADTARARPDGCQSAARYRPDGGCSCTRCTSAGTTDAGSGRSLMSSPGNAAWCISVRMSPGSTA